MIQVLIKRDQTGQIRGFIVQGHAGYDAHGRDIVCAAVSAVAQTAVLGLREVLHLSIQLRTREGYLSCQLPGRLSPDVVREAQVLLETMLVGIRDIQTGYPGFVEVKVSGKGVKEDDEPSTLCS
ncbi:MAG: ribosomal-processing cysteine protease Prp [Firmicutes bacterium]|nr:ribosomal-processing cysteine protease Prp [Bacillota bacterium]MCL5038605.1 ribosomal-processing cysteine protease Prp [Bacillota bacterium]